MQEKHWNFIQDESSFFIVAYVDPSIGKRSKSSYIQYFGVCPPMTVLLVMLERKGRGLPHFIYSQKTLMVQCKCLKKTMNVGYILSLVLNILNLFAHRCKEREIKNVSIYKIFKSWHFMLYSHTLYSILWVHYMSILVWQNDVPIVFFLLLLYYFFILKNWVYKL